MNAGERIAALPECIQPHIIPGDLCWSHVPVGWHNLVERLHNNPVKVEPDYVIDQVKEKFGSLCFYTQGPYHPDDLRCIIIQHYEALSRKTCAVCGNTDRVEVVNVAGAGRLPRCLKHRREQ